MRGRRVTVTPINLWPATAGSATLSARDGLSARGKASEVSSKFESFVLQMFVQEMLPKNASATFGKGFAGEAWRSMLAEKLAGEIAKNGGIGIAKIIDHSQQVKANALDVQKASPEAVRMASDASAGQSTWVTQVDVGADEAWGTHTVGADGTQGSNSTA